MGTKYKASAFGVFTDYPWIMTPDTKFNADGLYHTGHVLDGEEALAQKAEVDKLVDEAYEAFIKAEVEAGRGKEPKLRKEWGKYYPYEEETDDETGNPTGRICFKYKQNAIIRLKDGSTKAFKLGVRDASNKPVPKDTKVFSGSEGRVMWSARPNKVVASKLVGVRLDFSMAQITKLAEGTGGGFDAVEGGWQSGGDGDAADREANDSADY